MVLIKQKAGLTTPQFVTNVLYIVLENYYRNTGACFATQKYGFIQLNPIPGSIFRHWLDQYILKNNESLKLNKPERQSLQNISHKNPVLTGGIYIAQEYHNKI